MLDAAIWGALVALFTMPLFGIFGDRLGFKWVFMAGSVGILLFSSLFFSMLSSLNVASINLAMIIAIGLGLRLRLCWRFIETCFMFSDDRREYIVEIIENKVCFY